MVGGIVDVGDLVASGIAVIGLLVSGFSARYARIAVREARLAATRTRQYDLQSEARSHVEALGEHVDQARRWLESDNFGPERGHQAHNAYAAIVREASELVALAPRLRDKALRRSIEELAGIGAPSGPMAAVLTHIQHLRGDVGSTLNERETEAAGALRALTEVRTATVKVLGRLATLDAEGGE